MSTAEVALLLELLETIHAEGVAAAELNPPPEPCGGFEIREPQRDLGHVMAPCLQELATWHSLGKDRAWFTESKGLRSVVLGTYQ